MAQWEFAFDIDREGRTSLSHQIVRGLAAEIQRGRLRPGDRLPGSRTLAKTLSVHRQTVVSAMDDLVAEGWIVSRPAAGMFVADGLPKEHAHPRARMAHVRTRRQVDFPLLLRAAPEPELPHTVGARQLLMAGTRPDVRLIPAELIGRAYRRALRSCGAQLLSYVQPCGLLRLRQALAVMLASTRGLRVDARNVLVTRGSQMGLALVARALIQPGDRVAVEHPGYRPAWEAFRLAGAEIVPVPVDEHGLDVRALRALVARSRIRAVYATPHHQYPTTVTLAAPRRLELLQLAAEARFAIIEDDYDHEFHYTGRPVLPIASTDSEGLVIYIGTLSKVLAPGIRIGFVITTPDLIDRLAAYRSFADLQGDAVLEYAMADLFDDGLIQRHVRRMLRIYRSRLEALSDGLQHHLGGLLTFRRPSGGTAIWVRMRDAQTLTAWSYAAQRAGVLFDAGSAFTLDGAATEGARLGFACLTEDELKEAVRRLATAAQAVRAGASQSASLRR